MKDVYNLCKLRLGNSINIVVHDLDLYFRTLMHITRNPKAEVYSDPCAPETSVVGIVKCTDIEQIDNVVQFNAKEYSLIRYGWEDSILMSQARLTIDIKEMHEAIASAHDIDPVEVAIVFRVNAWYNGSILE